MKQTQLLKGVLEGCVLAIIQKEKIYGYELVQELRKSGFDDIVGGTVYPLLQKLEKQAAIIGDMQSSPDGPDRKYYILTEIGNERLLEFKEQWLLLTNNVDHILEGDEIK
ncbi:MULTISPECIES: PadR family transcriptional regulator [Vagococcus]|uniref:Transcriptional regulator, PadR family n=1 Tax=Vagococcus fluvialis bH819 TaxID=1255619 RepID=A0A1X6WPI7_9ENTE|nr:MULTISPECIES: PadR family transcriptional regulator [Vagococcus]SLM85576.1 Transcriptional regulator, PadR family [Vagococcus fluvialis bH819]HCM89545.1 PadR family transcriptional regulator [Vagococcus sp.]